MLKLLFLTIGLLVSVFLYFRVETQPPSAELPLFLRVDTIAATHKTAIDIAVHSAKKPSAAQLAQLESDYGDLWAHLNHLYATNDVEAGKEYYTEEWFRQLCTHYEGKRHASITRSDSLHHLNIINWSRDGLVCTAVDSNAVVTYTFPDHTVRRCSTLLAMVLLFQGDHWRLDAVRIMEEKEF